MPGYIDVYVVKGTALQPPSQNSIQATKGTWSPYIPHSFSNLTECPCGYLDRFSGHGRAIREAYEDAIVNMVDILKTKPDVIIAVIGSGGLLGEAFCLNKLVQKLWNDMAECSLTLHLVDKDYGKKNNLGPVNAFRTYAAKVIPQNKLLGIYVWDSCEALATAVKTNYKLRPDLVVGMDTEHATNVALKYQWEQLAQGDLNKALVVRWVPKRNYTFAFQIFTRRGSGELSRAEYSPSKFDEAAKYIRNAAFVP